MSFSFGQRIVLYHYVGNHQNTPENIAYVRDYVFSHPQEDLRMMAWKLASNLSQADKSDLSPVDEDRLLGALIAYNAGHIPAPDDLWWSRWHGNVANYRAALARADGLLGGLS